MKKGKIILILSVACGACFFLVSLIFPGDETLIDRKLDALAEFVSISPQQGLMTREDIRAQVDTFFDSEIRIQLNLPDGQANLFLSGIEKLKEYILMVRSQVRLLNVDFLEQSIEITEPHTKAVAFVTVRARVPSRPELEFSEFRLDLVKKDNEWKITHVESIRPLK